MRMTLKLAAGAIGAAMISSGAMAADIPVVAAPPPVVVPAPAFDWAGPYVGAMGGWMVGVVDVAAQGGINFVNGNMVYGVEARAGTAVFPGFAFAATVSGRAGILINPDLLLYGAAGLGFVPAGPELFFSVGGGAEKAIGSNLSLFIEARALGVFDSFACCGLSIQGGINWHL